MFGQFVHPGVYATVGLPAMKTWRAANATPQRRRLRADACRPVLDAVIAAGALHPNRLPRPWRRLVHP